MNSEPTWVDRAPCAGDVRFAPREDASDAIRQPTAPSLLLLSTCRSCPFRARCISRVRPASSHFDGVCGGRLWSNGQVIAYCAGLEADELHESGPYIPHGTESGARAHLRQGTPLCAICRWAARAATQERRAHTST